MKLKLYFTAKFFSLILSPMFMNRKLIENSTFEKKTNNP